MMNGSLPLIKSFFRGVSYTPFQQLFVTRMMIAFLMHFGRMSASQAAAAIRTDVCHRAQVTRFLTHTDLGNDSLGYQQLAEKLIHLDSKRHSKHGAKHGAKHGSKQGHWLFILDKTCVSRQGTKTQNTFSTGNRIRRKIKTARYSKKKYAPKRCHAFVMGLLITPKGYRIPFSRCYYTHDYCQQRQLKHYTEAELGAKLIRDLRVPNHAKVMVLGDTAYESQVVRKACEQREFSWIMPTNPERVIAGDQPRPKVKYAIIDFHPSTIFLHQAQANRRRLRCSSSHIALSTWVEN